MMETASRVEWIEAAAWSDMLQAVPKAAADRLGVSVRRVGAVRVLRATGIDHPLFNRAMGLGVAERGTREIVDQVVDSFQNVGVSRYFVHLPPSASASELGAWLEARGLEPYHRRWAKLVRGGERVDVEAPTGLTIRAARIEDAPAVGTLLASAFDVPEPGAVLFSSVVGRRRWLTYVAAHDDAVVAAGGLFADGNMGYVAFAATDPRYRKLGAQRALLARRLRDGLDLGCRAFVSETGESVPGDPQHSYKNLLQVGFREQYLRDNYAPRGLRWARAG